MSCLALERTLRSIALVSKDTVRYFRVDHENYLTEEFDPGSD